MSHSVKQPSFLDALIPVILLIALMSLAVYFFGDSSSFGPNQISLLLCSIIAALIGVKNGHRWEDIEEGIHKGIAIALTAVVILLAVGSLIGTWILSGAVPTLIYYGLHLISPELFYVTACFVSAIIAVSIGSSWTVAGTVGIGLMGIASGMGISAEITAGAVISGAYFGDKLSPLSDTTNLAPAAAGAELFEHIHHMLWTTIPALLLALLMFLLLGFNQQATPSEMALINIADDLAAHFNIGLHLLLPLAVLLFMAIKKYPAIPTITVGALLGAVMAVIFQPESVQALAAMEGAAGLVKGVWMALFDGYVAETANEDLNALLSKGGMSSMLNTVWLILCAMIFGGIVERLGLIQRLVEGLLNSIRGAGSLVVTTVLTAIGTNVVTADQYIAVVLPGRIYRAEFKRRGLKAVNLSRALEDGGTITSPLVPWNTCGAYMAATLGVATFAYLPFALFNLFNVVLAIAYALVGFKLTRIDDSDDDAGSAEPVPVEDSAQEPKLV